MIRNSFRLDNGTVATPADVKHLLGSGVPDPCAVDLGKLANAVRPLFMGLGAFFAGSLSGYVSNIKKKYSVDLGLK